MREEAVPPSGLMLVALSDYTALEQERNESYWYKQAQYRLSENERLRTAIRGVARQPTVKMWIGWMYPRSSA
jgi:hypothetical protein